jgi:hypothetical protein
MPDAILISRADFSYVPISPGYCSANLQVGILKSSRCPPEGGRYISQERARGLMQIWDTYFLPFRDFFSRATRLISFGSNTVEGPLPRPSRMSSRSLSSLSSPS